jgi:hypothetical protein
MVEEENWRRQGAAARFAASGAGSCTDGIQGRGSKGGSGVAKPRALGVRRRQRGGRRRGATAVAGSDAGALEHVYHLLHCTQW